MTSGYLSKIYHNMGIATERIVFLFSMKRRKVQYHKIRDHFSIPYGEVTGQSLLICPKIWKIDLILKKQTNKQPLGLFYLIICIQQLNARDACSQLLCDTLAPTSRFTDLKALIYCFPGGEQNKTVSSQGVALPLHITEWPSHTPAVLRKRNVHTHKQPISTKGRNLVVSKQPALKGSGWMK